MKFLALLLLVSLAYAEEHDTKPATLYAGYYGHYPTTLQYGYAGLPYAHHAGLPYAQHPYALAHPAVTYAAPTRPTVTYAAPTMKYVAPTVVTKPYTYYANSGGAVHIVKREAGDAGPNPESNPEADSDPKSYYYGYYGHPGYYRGYGGYGGYYGGYGGYGYWG